MHKVIRRLSTNKAPAEIGSFLGPVFIPSRRVTTRAASDNMRCSLTEKLEIRGGRGGGEEGWVQKLKYFETYSSYVFFYLSSFSVIGVGMKE